MAPTDPDRAAPDDGDASPAAPYAGLTPDCVLDALDGIGCLSDGRLQALNSFENRVYLVGQEDGPMVVAKFYRPQRWSDEAILEEHAFVADLQEAEVPAVPALVIGGRSLHQHAGYRFTVFARQGGRAPELDDRRQGRAMRERIGRYLGRIHAVGRRERFAVRPALDVASFGDEPRDYLLAHGFVPPDLQPAWSSVSAQALEGVRHVFERVGAVPTLRLHGDCHVGNVLWTDDGPHFVDFDDSRSGPAVQDLWMLLSGERSEQEQQLGEILAGYESFFDFDRRELGLIEALRTLRLLHYSAWLARRWSDPAFPAAFPWFDTQRYWQDRVLELREQIAAMDEAPLQPVLSEA
jgi:Ser/Thr protein kinase RdoA (MazF antagonist)